MQRDGANDTRSRVIEAAVQSIHEVGYYRATSNAIAERAGVSWGVIQYYFGNRESLMLAVLEDGAQRLVDLMRDVELTADTTFGRVEQYFELLADYHGSPIHLAMAQVMIDLVRDPNTSPATRLQLTEMAEMGIEEKDRLSRQMLRGNSAHRQELRDLVFYAAQGLGIGYVLSPNFAGDTKINAAAYRRRSTLMARAVALLIDEEQGRRSASRPRPEVP